MRKLQKLSMIVTLAVAFSNPAQAATLNFENNALDAGTFKWDAAKTLSGIDILFDRLKVEGTSKDGLYLCADCKLNFISGAYDAVNSIAGIVEFWKAGGSLVLTGTVHDGLGLGDAVIASGTLLTGSWAGTPFALSGLFALGGFSVQGFGLDTKDDELLAHFGLKNPFQFVSTQFNLSTCTTAMLSSLAGCEVDDADFKNTDQLGVVVPEPATLLLLGSGLLGLGHQARRRYKRASRT